MKTILRYLLTLALTLPFLGSPFYSIGQEKSDVVIMLSGEKKTGKVVAINDQSIKFVYTGESLEYEIKKELINKIEFASGRVEVLNSTAERRSQAPVMPEASSGAVARKNKIAILPFEILSNDPSLVTEAMSKQVQLGCADALRSIRPQQIIQDPNTTNVLLAKNNLTVENLSSKTPQEWADFLGVEYVIIGSYSIQNKGSVSSSNGYSSTSSQRKDDGKKKTIYTYDGGTSYTTTSYDTKVTLNIYLDNGTSIYSNTREPAFGKIDSYNSALKYMMKRTPLAR